MCIHDTYYDWTLLRWGQCRMEENWDVHSPLNVVGRRLQIRAQAIPCDHPGTHLCMGAWFQQELLLDANKHYVYSKTSGFGLSQTHGFTRIIVRMIVAFFKEKKVFSCLKATIILTIILVKPMRLAGAKPIFLAVDIMLVGIQQ